MSFDEFMTDEITVLKPNGDVIGDLKACVTRDQIHLERSDVLIEPCDLIERRTSNGATETFEVIDPGFYEASMGFKAHYQMRVRKLGLPESKQRIESITYNITGNNARVNNHSVDNSTNTVSINADAKNYIDGIRQIIESLTDQKQKAEALEIVEAVEVQLASSKPSKTVVSALLSALPHIASISTLVSSLISSIQ